MSDIKVGNKVIDSINDGEHIIYIVKSINGDKAVCVSFVNEDQEVIKSLSNLTRLTEEDDDNEDS